MNEFENFMMRQHIYHPRWEEITQQEQEFIIDFLKDLSIDGNQENQIVIITTTSEFSSLIINTLRKYQNPT